MQAKVHSTDGNYFIGSQPELSDFENLKVGGIEYVINFRAPGEIEKLEFSEEETLAMLGI